MRYIWKGTISFGLINIPVGLYSGSRDHELKFTLLHKKDLSEIRYARICKEEEKEVPYDQIVKGIEKNGHYTVLSAEDFKKSESEKTKTIDIITFCDSEEIDSIYYEKPYFLKAEKSGVKAYFLLQQALKQTKKVAVVRYTFKNHNHLAVIKPYEHVLVLNQLRFASQIISLEELNIQENIKFSAAEITMAKKLIDQLSGHFEANSYHDSYIEDLQDLISKKGEKTKVKAMKKTEKTAKVYDLMALLKASIDKKKTAPVKTKTRAP